jgi:WD40 repeat protein
MIISLERHTDKVTAVSFSPDGKCLASGSKDKTIILWSMNSFKEIAKLKGHVEGVTSIAFSADGKCLASASKDCTVVIWNI